MSTITVQDVAPGNPPQIIEHAHMYKRLEESLTECVHRLDNLTNQTQSKAQFITAVTGKMKELRNMIVRATVRTQGPSEALSRFGPTLQELQNRANQVIQQEAETRRQVEHRISQHTEVGQSLARMDSNNPAQANYLVQMYNSLGSQISQGNQQLSALNGQISQIRNQYNEAVNIAVNTITQYKEQSHIKDTFFTKVVNVFNKVLDFVTGIVTKFVEPLETLANGITSIFSSAAGFVGKISGFLDGVGLGILATPFKVVESGLSLISHVPQVLITPFTMGKNSLQFLNGDLTSEQYINKTIDSTMNFGKHLVGGVKDAAYLAATYYGGPKAAMLLKAANTLDLPQKIYNGAGHIFGFKAGNVFDDAGSAAKNWMHSTFGQNISLMPNLHNRRYKDVR